MVVELCKLIAVAARTPPPLTDDPAKTAEDMVGSVDPLIAPMKLPETPVRLEIILGNDASPG